MDAERRRETGRPRRRREVRERLHREQERAQCAREALAQALHDWHSLQPWSPKSRAAQHRTEQQRGRWQGAVGDRTGMMLEDRSRERVLASCSRLVQRTPVVCGDAWVALLKGAVARGVLSEEGADEGARAGAVVRGQRRADSAEVSLVVEISWG